MLIVTGCKADLPDTKLIFGANHDFASERIELFPNGSFTHIVKLNIKQNEILSKGYWHYGKDKKYMIFDSNYMLVVDGHGKFNNEFESKSDGFVSLPVYSWLGDILMGSDEVVLYKLQK